MSFPLRVSSVLLVIIHISSLQPVVSARDLVYPVGHDVKILADSLEAAPLGIGYYLSFEAITKRYGAASLTVFDADRDKIGHYYIRGKRGETGFSDIIGNIFENPTVALNPFDTSDLYENTELSFFLPNDGYFTVDGSTRNAFALNIALSLAEAVTIVPVAGKTLGEVVKEVTVIVMDTYIEQAIDLYNTGGSNHVLKEIGADLLVEVIARSPDIIAKVAGIELAQAAGGAVFAAVNAALAPLAIGVNTYGSLNYWKLCEHAVKEKGEIPVKVRYNPVSRELERVLTLVTNSTSLAIAYPPDDQVYDAGETIFINWEVMSTVVGDLPRDSQGQIYFTMKIYNNASSPTPTDTATLYDNGAGRLKWTIPSTYTGDTYLLLRRADNRNSDTVTINVRPAGAKSLNSSVSSSNL